MTALAVGQGGVSGRVEEDARRQVRQLQPSRHKGQVTTSQSLVASGKPCMTVDCEKGGASESVASP